jgi:RecA/RadA recombinase
MTTESVEKHTIGDHAQTIGIGLKRILEVIRRHNIALVLINQVRDELDMTEQMRGNKFKMQAGWALKHFAEYFVAVESNATKDGRTDIMGREFVDENQTDLAGKGETTAMKIRVKMKDSNMGPKGRTGEFTFDFHRGIINQHEEVFKLGFNRGVITSEKQGTYEFSGQSWRGKESCLNAIKESQELSDAIVDELRRRDEAGEFSSVTDSEPVQAEE